MIEAPAKPHDRPDRRVQIGLFVLLSLIAVAAIAIRVRLLNMPLERDEGEYAYGGQMILHGVPPYTGFYTMKWPGTHLVYALFMSLFGETAAAIHLGLIVVNVATAILVFFVARTVLGFVGSMVAAAAYTLFSINPMIMGLQAHATHFVILPALAAILLLRHSAGSHSGLRIFSAGLLFGLAGIMKQSGAIFGLFAVSWMIWQECAAPKRNLRSLFSRLAFLILGGLLPVAVLFLVIARIGAFSQFWFWTFEYARQYASENTPISGLEFLLEKMDKLFRAVPILWAAAAIGMGLLCSKESLARARPFVLGFALFSFLAVCPAWIFRPHYFLLFIPAAGLLAGVAAEYLHDRIAEKQGRRTAGSLILLLLLLTFSWILYQWRAVYFQLSPRQISHALYYSPFPEMVDVAEYLKAHCPPNGRIAVLGSEPQIYFYSGRKAVTGYLYMYPLMERQPYATMMQQQLIREIEASSPDYVVFVHCADSWLGTWNSPALFNEWFKPYKQNHLRLVAWINLQSDDNAEYHWSDSDESKLPENGVWLGIFKKK